MNAKKYIVAAIVLNTLLLAFAACFHCLPCRAQSGANELGAMASNGRGGKFRPVVEAVLPAAKTDKPAEILDLETGRTLPDPAFADFDFRADAITTWIRTNGLDISCQVWSTLAACVTYDMTTIAVEGKCWNETTEEDLLANPALAPKLHSPRRQLVLGSNSPDTYIFRTGQGTLGILRIMGVTEDRQGVRIRYKLLAPMNDNQTTSASTARGTANLLTAH